MDNERKYVAFISYRHKPLDTALAKTLHTMLEHYVVDKELRKDPEQKHLGIVFRDRDELPLSNDLSEDIYTALDNSEYLIVICTQDTPKSIWVRREIEYFTVRHGHDRVLTVLAQEPPELCFPPELTEVRDAAGNIIDRIEPLAAYVVGSNKLHSLWKLQAEFLRLVAAILGKPYGEIKQRQKRYRQRQLMAGMAVTLGVAAVFIGMLLNRNAQINAQNVQIAAQNQQIEEKNQQIQLQLEQSQRNESTALALLSAQKLQQGDRLGAIETAMNALPTGENGRPYLAQAEAALADALYVYQEPALRAQLLLEQPAAIYRTAQTKDGKLLLTLDGAYILRCFDTATARMVWSVQVLEGNSLLDPYSKNVSLQIFHDQQTVYAMGKVYDLHSGSYLHRLTESDFPAGMDFDEEVFSADFSIRAFPLRSNTMGGDGERVYTHRMVFQDTATGQITAQSDPLPLSTIFHTAVKGCFSPDGSRYVAGFWSDTATKIDKNGTTWILCLDTATGDVLWKYSLPNAQDPSCIMLCDGSVRVFWHDGENAYLVYLSSAGEWLGEAALSSVPAQLPVILNRGDYGYFLFSQCVLGNVPEGHFSVALPDVFVSADMMDDGSILAFLQDGSVRRIGAQDGYYFDDAYVDLDDTLRFGGAAGGVLSYVTQEEPSRVCVMGTLGEDNEKSLSFTNPQNDDTLYFTTKIYPMPDGQHFAVFEYYPAYDAGFHGYTTDTYVITVYDGSLTITDQFSFQFGENSERNLSGITADGTKFILDDLVVDLSQRTVSALYDGTNEFKSSPGTPLVTAGYDRNAQMLLWWTDGQDMQSAPMPGEGSFTLTGVTQNGAILFSEQAAMPDTGEKLGTFRVFSTKERQWYQIFEPAPELYSVSAAMGSTCSRVAVLDGNGVLRIVDWESGATVLHMALSLSDGTEKKLCFAHDDQVLLISDWKNHLITVISASDGSVLGSYAAEVGLELTVQEDPQRQVLYIGSPDGGFAGLQIHTESWIATARIPRLTCCAGDSQLILLEDVPDTRFARIGVCPVYDLEQLMEKGRAVLGGD